MILSLNKNGGFLADKKSFNHGFNVVLDFQIYYNVWLLKSY